MKHHCHVNKCQTRTEPRLLMCARHWAMVPIEMRADVNKAFNPEQCSKRVRPSMEWLTAARAALNYVAKLEGTFIEAQP